MVFLIALGLVSADGLAEAARDWRAAVAQVSRFAPDARIVVLDAATGKLLASRRFDQAARTLAAPGSTLKPLVLYGLLAEGRWDPERRVACDRQLTVAGRRLGCTHPLAPPFNAREALTWSCNTYFAEAARSLNPGELQRLLQPTGLLGETGLGSGEATAEFREPRSPEENELALLGVEGIRVTPLELAAAYRWLARQIASHPGTNAASVVLGGLEDSTSYGMAGAAGLGGVPIAGKTGTAEGAVSSRTHGWFAGLAPAEDPQVVVVVYLPAGRGADAARVAGELLARSPLEQR